eukprot:582677-Heterocapsa_arctica.AAC.1
MRLTLLALASESAADLSTLASWSKLGFGMKSGVSSVLTPPSGGPASALLVCLLLASSRIR